MTSIKDRLRAAVEPVLFGIVFGLIAGAAQALYYIYFRVTSDDFLWNNDMVVYLSPLGHVVYLLVPAVGLAAIAFVWPRLLSTRVVVALLATAALFSVLLSFTKIHHLALLALAVGASIQVARIITRRPQPARFWLTWASTAILAATIVAAIAIPATSRRKERAAVQALPPAQPNAPNVLLVILDAVRASRLHLYGYAQPTSDRLEQLASEGLVFDRAMATSSWTLASLASLITGQYPTSVSADWTIPLDGQHPVLAEVLQQRGYLTGMFSANPHYMTRETGLGRGVAHFEDLHPSFIEALLTVSIAQSKLVKDARGALQNGSPKDLFGALASFHWARAATTLTHERKPAEHVAGGFLDWQESAGERPWFAMLNFFDAHAPYKPQAPFDTMFAKDLAGDYDGAVATIDRELGRMLDELRARGVLDRTIVIVTADHGELLGEHGWEHGSSLYRLLLHVPLVIRAPARVPAGVHVRQTVSLRDLAATILDLVDPSLMEPPELGGQSLRDAWTGTPGFQPSPAFAALTYEARRRQSAPHNWIFFSLVDDSTHYLRNVDGKELLFDVRTDADEWNNLMRTDSGRSVASVMRARVDSVLRAAR